MTSPTNRNRERPAPLQVYCSNQIEQLAQCLIENFERSKDSPTDRLFAAPTIVVPNRSIEAYLKYEIARSAGIAAGLKFQMIEQFIDDLLSQTAEDPRPRLARTNVLRSFFIDVLSPSPEPSHALPVPVEQYVVAAGDSADAQDLRRFQLASRLAGLARTYGNHRPAWLQEWAKGKTVGIEESLATTEVWQRELWARLTELVRRQEPSELRWVLPADGSQWLTKLELKSINEVHLFGFSYISQSLHDLIGHLNQKVPFSIYSPVPFLVSQCVTRAQKTTPRKAAQARRKAASESAVDTLFPPERLAMVELWGRPGLEYFSALEEIPKIEFTPRFVMIEKATVLGRLQREILRNDREPADNPTPDESLVVVASPSVRREAEFIANEIWRLIRQSGGPGDDPSNRLLFRDIAVLIADSSNRASYQAHIRAAFEELHHIPSNTIDLPLVGECRIIEGLLLLLALPFSEFTRPEVLKILAHPAVRARFPDADFERWRDWCLGLEILHGADRADHERTYIDRELFHWEQGLKRLMLGIFMSGSESGDTRVFQSEDAEYLPYDQPALALEDVGYFVALMRSLIADARFALNAQLTMTEWSTFFARMTSAYLTPDSEPEERALSKCLQEIEGLRILDVSGRKVSYRIAYESLRASLEGLTGARGQYLAEGVVVSPLIEMRSLPFRIIFLCGLGEGRFPATDGPNPLDLTLETRQVGDINPRDRDKYLFLETLVCARERLYLSYVARDAQTGDELAPSTVVQELIRHLSAGGVEHAAERWINKQPLRRFDDSQFAMTRVAKSPESLFLSYSFSAWKESHSRILRQSLRDHCGGNPRLTPDELRLLDQEIGEWLGLIPIPAAPSKLIDACVVSIRDLLAFLRCPLQGWARFALRLREDDTALVIAREDEPFVTGRVDETTMLREVFFDGLGKSAHDPTTDDFEQLYRVHAAARIRQGLIPIGLFGEAESRRHLECLSHWRQTLEQQLPGSGSRLHVYRFGRASERERVDRLEHPIVLDVPVWQDAPAVRVELHGRTGLVTDELSASITPVLKDKPTHKDFLAGFLDAVVLSLMPGRSLSRDYHAHVIPGAEGADPGKLRRAFHGIDAAKSREFLVNLIADMLGGPHAYLLPCEAVFEAIDKGRRVDSSVEEMKEDEHKSCSSRHGPVSDFTVYDPPPEDEVHRIIDRRFGLFRDSGGLGR